MKKIINLCIIFFFLICFKNVSSNELKIIVKLNNDIITNIDIENEKNFLSILNEELEKLNGKEFFDLAKNSLIKEKIKKIEIEKYIDVNQEFEFENELIAKFYKKQNLNNENELKNFLKEKNLEYNLVKKKLLIEALWNQIVYEKYKNNIKINREKIEKDIKNYINNLDRKYEYKLSEILISENQISPKKLYATIDEVGFKVAANKLSNSDTSKFGGEIGWVKETNLSSKILNKINKLEIGEISDPIEIQGSYIVLKIDEKKQIKLNYDLQKEIKNQIAYETNQQLNKYSLNYYKRLKQNTIVNEN